MREKGKETVLSTEGDWREPLCEGVEPTRHTFILRLIPDLCSRINSAPRWRGELQHSAGGGKPERKKFKDVYEMLRSVKHSVNKLVSES